MKIKDWINSDIYEALIEYHASNNYEGNVKEYVKEAFSILFWAVQDEIIGRAIDETLKHGKYMNQTELIKLIKAKTKLV